MSNHTSIQSINQLLAAKAKAISGVVFKKVTPIQVLQIAQILEDNTIPVAPSNKVSTVEATKAKTPVKKAVSVKANKTKKRIPVAKGTWNTAVDWNKLMDGETHIVEIGHITGANWSVFRQAVWSRAEKSGLKATVRRISNKSGTVRFFLPETATTTNN